MNYFKVEVGISQVGGGGGGVKLRGQGVTNGKSVVRRCHRFYGNGLPLTFLFLTRRFG